MTPPDQRGKSTTTILSKEGGKTIKGGRRTGKYADDDDSSDDNDWWTNEYWTFKKCICNLFALFTNTSHKLLATLSEHFRPIGMPFLFSGYNKCEIKITCSETFLHLGRSNNTFGLLAS